MLIQSGVLAQSVIVDAPWGLVRGYYEENGLGVSFQGIKYAQADRWQDPIPYSYGKNDAPFDAIGPTPGCPQLCNLPKHLCPTSFQEDCLFLNVYTPAAPATTSTTNPLPVMVYLHPGNFRAGGAGSVLLSGSELTTGQVLVVTLNYRLGALGWLRQPSLNITGNFGLMDQIAALQWVRDNIASFGGDVNNISLIGHASGAMSIPLLATYSKTKDLFHKAILLSAHFSIPFREHNATSVLSDSFIDKAKCSSLTISPTAGQQQSNTAECGTTTSSLMLPNVGDDDDDDDDGVDDDAGSTTGDVIESTPLTDASTTRQCLLDLPITTLLNAQQQAEHDPVVLMQSLFIAFLPWAPYIDPENELSPKQPLHIIQQNLFPATMPVLLGVTSDETVYYIYEVFSDDVDLAAYCATMSLLFGCTRTELIAKMYPHIFDDYRPQLVSMANQFVFEYAVGNVSHSLLQSSHPPTPDDPPSSRRNVWMYNFAHIISDYDYWTETQAYCFHRACHGVDIPFTFGMANMRAAGLDFTDQEVLLSLKWRQTLWNFVYTGNPNNGPSILDFSWPSYADERAILSFTSPMPRSTQFNATMQSFWDQVDYMPSIADTNHTNCVCT